MLKPTTWNKLVWEGCHCWPSRVQGTLESPAVQDPLFLFSMTLQPSVENAAYEGENSFSFRATSLMRMVSDSSYFLGLSGLLLVLRSLEIGGDIKNADPCKAKRYTVGQRWNHLRWIGIREGEKRKRSIIWVLLTKLISSGCVYK